jgi:hypothetical protein
VVATTLVLMLWSRPVQLAEQTGRMNRAAPSGKTGDARNGKSGRPLRRDTGGAIFSIFQSPSLILLSGFCFVEVRNALRFGSKFIRLGRSVAGASGMPVSAVFWIMHRRRYHAQGDARLLGRPNLFAAPEQDRCFKHGRI